VQSTAGSLFLGLLGFRTRSCFASPLRGSFVTRVPAVLNPVRSEAEAFRFLLYVIVVVAVIVGLIFALRAVL
jgi:hypothetical protein